MFYTYILKSINFGTYYVGSTKNLENRLKLHNSGCVKSTKNKRPWKLIHKEKFESLGKARKRELEIKAWRKRSAIEQLILGL